MIPSQKNRNKLSETTTNGANGNEMANKHTVAGTFRKF